MNEKQPQVRQRQQLAIRAAVLSISTVVLTGCGEQADEPVHLTGKVVRPKDACAKLPALKKHLAVVTMPNGATTIPDTQIKEASPQYRANQLTICTTLYEFAGRVVRLYEHYQNSPGPRVTVSRQPETSNTQVSLYVDINDTSKQKAATVPEHTEDFRRTIATFSVTPDGQPDLTHPESVDLIVSRAMPNGVSAVHTFSIGAPDSNGNKVYEASTETFDSPTFTQIPGYQFRLMEMGGAEFNPTAASQQAEARDFSFMLSTAERIMKP